MEANEVLPPNAIYRDRICTVTPRPDVWGPSRGEGEFAPGAYEITDAHGGGFLQTILFQRAPVKVAGMNGVTMEALLAICADRLRAFQRSPYYCEENERALWHVQAAIEALESRTAGREKRGVEGTYTA